MDSSVPNLVEDCIEEINRLDSDVRTLVGMITSLHAFIVNPEVQLSNVAIDFGSISQNELKGGRSGLGALSDQNKRMLLNSLDANGLPCLFSYGDNATLVGSQASATTPVIHPQGRTLRGTSKMTRFATERSITSNSTSRNLDLSLPKRESTSVKLASPSASKNSNSSTVALAGAQNPQLSQESEVETKGLVASLFGHLWPTEEDENSAARKVLVDDGVHEESDGDEEDILEEEETNVSSVVRHRGSFLLGHGVGGVLSTLNEQPLTDSPSRSKEQALFLENDSNL